MADTKRMEMVAENLIAHYLQRHGILVAKPQFDQEAGDLFAITTEGGLRFCRIQCKGRAVSPDKDNNVTVSAAHVATGTLVVCLFVDDGSFDALNLYAFFRDEIENNWSSTHGGKFYLGLKVREIRERTRKVQGRTAHD